MAEKPEFAYRNKVLAQEIEARYPSVREFCRIEKFDPEKLDDLLYCEVGPFTKTNRPTRIARRLLQTLDTTPDHLFPPWLYRSNHPEQLFSELSREATRKLKSLRDVQDPPANVDALLLKDKIDQVLQTLTYREREIIKLRYGLGDGYTYTLEEVGRIFKVTRERVRMIEAKAVRKLQHPVRSRQIAGFLEETRPAHPTP